MASGATHERAPRRPLIRMRHRASRPGALAVSRVLCNLSLSLVLFAPVAGEPALAGSSGQSERAAAGRVKSGTGFFVSDDGFLVTSAHVVTGCRDVSSWEPNGTRRPSYVIALDRRLDLALLWVDGVSKGLSAMVTRMPPHLGESVYTLGYGVIATKPLRPVLVEGSLIGDRTARPGNNRIIVIRANLHAGHSGGAVLARDGSLLGMIVGRDEEQPQLGVAVPKEDIESLLSAYGIHLPKRDPAPNAQEFLGSISVLIQCSSVASSEPPAGAGPRYPQARRLDETILRKEEQPR